MSREMKFRAWDEITKKMWYPEQGLKACVTQIGSVCVDETDEGGRLENRNYRLRVLFYTGLHDKKGKEIYEGDIVTRYSEGRYKIYWHEFTACWRMTGHTGIDKGDMALACEVIGNVYENPELL